MKIIITMAGMGSRFREIGLDKPKHEIYANGKTLFEWSLLSLKDFFSDEFIFIVREGFYNENFIIKILNQLDIKKFHIVVVDELTDGQASTCLCADNLLSGTDSICIFNIDTYITPGKLKRDDITDDIIGYIPAFRGSGDRWSFIKLDKNGLVKDITEKIRISDFCSIGLYYFKEWNIYKEVYNLYKDEVKSQYNEVYIAPLYKYLIDKKHKLTTSIIDSKDVFILGTPDDVRKFDPEYISKN